MTPQTYTAMSQPSKVGHIEDAPAPASKGEREGQADDAREYRHLQKLGKETVQPAMISPVDFCSNLLATLCFYLWPRHNGQRNTVLTINLFFCSTQNSPTPAHFSQRLLTAHSPNDLF